MTPPGPTDAPGARREAQPTAQQARTAQQIATGPEGNPTVPQGPPTAPRQHALAPGSLRIRLTAVYGSLFFLTGTAMLAITYGLVAHQLDGREGIPLGAYGASWRALGRAFRDRATGGSAYRNPMDVIRGARADERASALHELLTQSAVALVLMTVIAVALGWLFAGRALRPLRDITATARRLSTHNLDQRIDLPGPGGELKDLADTFDDMLARLSAAFEAQRHFAANASHELRTPLAVQRAAIDVALANPTQKSLETMALRLRTAIERHEHVIESLLTLARSQSGIEHYRPVDLADAAGAALAAAEEEIRGRGLRVSQELAPAALPGDPVLLERLAVNLVQNAARHNTDGGWLSVHTHGDGGSVTLRVANSGRTLAPEAAAGLFRPFRRLAPERGAAGGASGSAGRPARPAGSGLGLSIVAAIATAHGGSCTARARTEGGLEVTVTLPCRHTPGPPPASSAQLPELSALLPGSGRSQFQP